jgi:hypothetical protein
MAGAVMAPCRNERINRGLFSKRIISRLTGSPISVNDEIFLAIPSVKKLD